MLTVILNSTSGARHHDELQAELAGLFDAAGAAAHIVECAAVHGIAEVVRDAVARGCEAVVAGGGDGTISAVASALAGGPVPLGVLPLGTFNHFARDLGLPLELPQAVETIVSGRTARIDIGRVNERAFINNASIGVYPSIVERREALRQKGHRKWPALMRATAEILRRDQAVSVRLSANGRQIASDTPFVFVGNNEYRVEGIHLGSRSTLNAGALFVYFAPPVRTRYLPALLLEALAGQARRRRLLEAVSATELQVEMPGARTIQLACDGEVITLPSPLHFAIWPSALSVLV